MALMMGQLYAALKAASIDEELARKAAEEAASHETRFDSLEAKLLRIEGSVSLLQWMLGTSIALQLTGFGWILSRLPTH